MPCSSADSRRPGGTQRESFRRERASPRQTARWGCRKASAASRERRANPARASIAADRRALRCVVCLLPTGLSRSAFSPIPSRRPSPLLHSRVSARRARGTSSPMPAAYLTEPFPALPSRLARAGEHAAGEWGCSRLLAAGAAHLLQHRVRMQPRGSRSHRSRETRSIPELEVAGTTIGRYGAAAWLTLAVSRDASYVMSRAVLATV